MVHSVNTVLGMAAILDQRSWLFCWSHRGGRDRHGIW